MWIFRPFKKSICAFTLPGSFFTARARKPAFCQVLIRSGSAESHHISVFGSMPALFAMPMISPVSFSKQYTSDVMYSSPSFHPTPRMAFAWLYPKSWP